MDPLYLGLVDKAAFQWRNASHLIEFVLLRQDDKDSVERGLINLATAVVEYSEDQEAVNGMPHAFRFPRWNFLGTRLISRFTNIPNFYHVVNFVVGHRCGVVQTWQMSSSLLRYYLKLVSIVLDLR